MSLVLGSLSIASWGLQCQTSSLSVREYKGCVSELTKNISLTYVHVLHEEREDMEKIDFIYSLRQSGPAAAN